MWLLQTYLNAAINCVAQNYLFPRSWWGLHHNIYGTKAVHSSASSMHLLQSSNVAAALLKNILQSMDEESIKNIILDRCGKKEVSFSLLEQLVCLIPTVGTHSSFPPQTAFLSKLYPIQENICTSNHTPDYSTWKVQLWQYPYFKELRFPETVNIMPLLWFFRYNPQTSHNE